jgi:amphiphysin
LGAEDNDYSTHVPVNTPPTTMQRCTELYTAFTELRTDMMEEVRDIETKLIQPARGARDSLKPMKKAIKKREDKKVRPLIVPRCHRTDGCAPG